MSIVLRCAELNATKDGESEFMKLVQARVALSLSLGMRCVDRISNTRGGELFVRSDRGALWSGVGPPERSTQGTEGRAYTRMPPMTLACASLSPLAVPLCVLRCC